MSMVPAVSGYVVMPLFVMVGVRLVAHSRGAYAPALLVSLVYLASRLVGLLVPSGWMFSQALTPERLDLRLALAMTEALAVWTGVVSLGDLARPRRDDP